MNNSKKRIIICGLGSIGLKHVHLLNQQFPQTKIAALRSGKGVPYLFEETTLDDQFYSIDEAINWSPDGVIIASPASCHIQQALFFAAASGGRNSAATAMAVEKNSTTSRSINAAGTINASGADYDGYESYEFINE